MELTLEERVYRLEIALRIQTPVNDVSIDYGNVLMGILAKYSGYTDVELKSKSRKTDLVRFRQIGMNVLMEYSKMNLTNIGRLFGGRDHATVIHARMCHEDRLSLAKLNKEYIHDYEKVKQYFTQAILGNNEHLEPIINPS